MSWVAVAVGSSVAGAGASIYGANKAAGAMKKASREELALQREMYNDQMRRNAPYEAVGGSALNAYARAMGLPQHRADPANDPSMSYQWSQSGVASEYEVKKAFQEFLGREPTKTELKYYTGKRSGDSLFKKSTPSGVLGGKKGNRQRANELYYDVIAPGLKNRQSAAPQQQEVETDRYGGFEASPGYQFRLDEGARGLDRNMAARGLLNSGARGKAMTRYNQGVASDEFGNYMNRLAGAAGIGQTAANNANTMSGNFAINAGNAINNRGMARASGYLGMGNAVSSGVNNVLSALPYMQRPGGQPGRPPPAINPTLTVR
jgi:hypothetical protein